MRPEAVAAMEPFLRGTFGNPSGGHAAARAAKTALEEAREEVAELLGARPTEVVFTAGGTEADNLAVKGGARHARDAGLGDGVVTTGFEHKGVLASCDRLVAEGFRVATVVLPSTGVVDVDALVAEVDDRTVLVSVMLVNNEVGTIQPLDEIVARVRERAPRALVHTDAVQAVPWLDVARATAAVDLVAISAHKFGGPKGTGALVVRDGVVLQPLIEGGGQEGGVRSGTSNVAGAVAMAAALRATHAGRDAEVRADRTPAGTTRRRSPRRRLRHVRERGSVGQGRRQRAPGLPRDRGRDPAGRARPGGSVRGRGLLVLVGGDRPVTRARGDGRAPRRRAVVDPVEPRVRVDRRRCRRRPRRHPRRRGEAPPRRRRGARSECPVEKA